MKKNFLMTGAALLFATAVMADVPDGIGSITVHDAQMYAQHNGVIPEGGLVEVEGMKCDFKMVSLAGVSYAWIKSNTALIDADWGTQFRYYINAGGTSGAAGALVKIENPIGNGSLEISTKLPNTFDEERIEKVSIFLSKTDGSFNETALYDFKAATNNSLDANNATIPVINSVTTTVSGLNVKLAIDGDDTDVFYYIEDQALGYKTFALTKNAALDGLLPDKTYNLTVTPVHMISGKKGEAKTTTFTLGEAAESITIIPSADLFTGFHNQASMMTFETVNDEEMGEVVKITLTDPGANYNGFTMENADVLAQVGLGSNGGEYTYAHMIAKCVEWQQVRAIFSGENFTIDGENGLVPGDVWMDIRFVTGSKTKSKIDKLAIMPDYSKAAPEKVIYVQKIVINNSETPLITPPVSISNAAQENIESIYAVDGTIFVNSDQAQTINVYSIDGRKVSSVVATEGTTTINGLAKGVYVVNNQKVVVK